MGRQERVNKCGNRYVGFNNHAKGIERDEQVQDLIAQIDRIGKLTEYSISNGSSPSGETWWTKCLSYAPSVSDISNIISGMTKLIRSYRIKYILGAGTLLIIGATCLYFRHFTVVTSEVCFSTLAIDFITTTLFGYNVN